MAYAGQICFRPILGDVKSSGACGFEFKYLSDLGKCVLVAPLKMISLVGKLQQDRDTNYEITEIGTNHTCRVRYDDDNRLESNVESLTFIDVLEGTSGLTCGILVKAVDMDNTEYRRIGVIAVDGITIVKGKQVYVI